MATLNNPFVIYGYKGSEYFCDREEETEKMISALHNERNVTLVSPRRMGKTGLVKHVFAKMEKQDITPKVLDKMGISGAFNGWEFEDMLPYNKEGVENHAWYYVLEVTPDVCTDGVCGFKFRPNEEWKGYGSVKNAVNYVGVAGDGEDLGLPVGKYCISYNDINGEFSIVAL